MTEAEKERVDVVAWLRLTELAYSRASLGLCLRYGFWFGLGQWLCRKAISFAIGGLALSVERGDHLRDK